MLAFGANTPIRTNREARDIFCGGSQHPGCFRGAPPAYLRVLWLHDQFGSVLIALGGVHVAAVAVHMLIWRDGLLGRMWFGRRRPNRSGRVPRVDGLATAALSVRFPAVPR